MQSNFQLTSVQMGKIGEAVVSSQLLLASGGRLCPFTAFADDDGVDLLVLDKKTRRVLALQVKARRARDASTGTVQFDVGLRTFQEHPNALLIAILLDQNGAGGLERLWLIPSSELPGVGKRGEEKISIRPSPSPTSKDRYAIYGYQDMRGVAARLTEIIDGPPEEATTIGDEADARLAGPLRLLQMVRRLHERGYEKLRVSPGMSPSGAHWRCTFASADNVAADGFTVLNDRDERLAVPYTSGDEPRPFGWKIADGETIEDLADRFIATFPVLMEFAQGIDRDYAGWLANILRAGEAGRFPVLYGDQREANIPLPPAPVRSDQSRA